MSSSNTINSNLDSARSCEQTQRRPTTTGYSHGACITCRRRKVKCDQNAPCSNCVRNAIKCEIVPRKRSVRRPKTIADKEKQELIQRVHKLETIMKDLSESVEDDTRALSNSSPEQSMQNDGFVDLPDYQLPAIRSEQDFGTLAVSNEGKTRYVDSLLDLISDEPDNDGSDSACFPEVHNVSPSFVFGYCSIAVQLRNLHPLPSQLPFFLQMYSQRVDPIVKVLHIPSMEILMKGAQENLASLNRSQEALLFALYFAVTVSMSAEEVKSNFAWEKTYALGHYRFGVEQALARASFLDTTELTTLQAFVIYLACMEAQDGSTPFRSENESRVGWTLIRSAIGIAQSMGLHQDGSSFALSPFEKEMRRRLWWQLCVLDFRSSDKHDTEPAFPYAKTDCPAPLNINDLDLLPNAVALPDLRLGLTEITLTRMTCDIVEASKSMEYRLFELGPSIDVRQLPYKEAVLEQFHQHFEHKYGRFCADNGPTAPLISIICKLILLKMKSMLLLPLIRPLNAQSSPPEINDKMFIVSIEMVELQQRLEDENTRPWSWYLKTFVHWEPMRYLLSELCTRPPDENTTHAWKVLDEVLLGWRLGKRQPAPGKPWLSMNKLIGRARWKRQMDCFEAILDGTVVPSNRGVYSDARLLGTNSMTGAHSCDAQENLTALPMWEGFGMDGRLSVDECEWQDTSVPGSQYNANSQMDYRYSRGFPPIFPKRIER